MGYSLPSAPWSGRERRAWRIPPALKVSEWAEQNRYLTQKQSNLPGRYRHEWAPYSIGLMNLPQHPRIQEVWVQKAAQMGISEAFRCVIGYWADRDPDPALFVMPDEEHGRKIINERLIPLFEDTPCLKSLHTGIRRDVKLNSISLLNAFRLRLGYSGSPTSLKSDPVRYVDFDEIDDFQPFSGKNADPISMARKRTRTYGRRRRLIGPSTPTVPDAGISLLVSESPIRLYYYVPCPHCGKYQRLTFDRLKWGKPEGTVEKTAVSAWIKEHRAAWFECRECGRQIANEQKADIVRRGLWATEEIGTQLVWNDADKHVVTPGGQRCQGGDYAEEGWPPGDRVGCQIGGFYCLWLDWWDIAAEFVLAQGDIAKLIDLYNQTFGEPFKSQITRTPSGIFERKTQAGGAPRVVPKWASALIATVDVQMSRMYWVIRAWGQGDLSQRIDHGQVYSFEELSQRLLESRYPNEDKSLPAMRIRAVGIDSGYREKEVYRWSLTDPRIKVLKGDKPKTKPITTSRQTYQDPRRPDTGHHVYLHLLDANHFKDLLAGLIQRKDDFLDEETGRLDEAADVWRLNSEMDEDYNRQMASEHKILIRKGRSVPVETWVQVTSGAANHYWDCEYYQVAMADVAGVDFLRPPQPQKRQGPPEDKRERARGPIRRQYE